MKFFFITRHFVRKSLAKKEGMNIIRYQIHKIYKPVLRDRLVRNLLFQHGAE